MEVISKNLECGRTVEQNKSYNENANRDFVECSGSEKVKIEPRHEKNCFLHMFSLHILHKPSTS